MRTAERRADTVEAMEALGAELAAVSVGLRLMTLRGPLGAGKTTLVRGMLHALGYAGAVKSPTFTLVEPYALGARTFCHFDLYRLKDPEELEFMGMRDYLQPENLCVVEWPERAGVLLPPADVEVIIEPVDRYRRVQLIAHNQSGEAALAQLQ